MRKTKYDYQIERRDGIIYSDITYCDSDCKRKCVRLDTPIGVPISMSKLNEVCIKYLPNKEA